MDNNITGNLSLFPLDPNQVDHNPRIFFEADFLNKFDLSNVSINISMFEQMIRSDDDDDQENCSNKNGINSQPVPSPPKAFGKPSKRRSNRVMERSSGPSSQASIERPETPRFTYGKRMDLIRKHLNQLNDQSTSTVGKSVPRQKCPKKASKKRSKKKSTKLTRIRSIRLRSKRTRPQPKRQCKRTRVSKPSSPPPSAKEAHPALLNLTIPNHEHPQLHLQITVPQARQYRSNVRAIIKQQIESMSRAEAWSYLNRGREYHRAKLMKLSRALKARQLFTEEYRKLKNFTSYRK